MTEDQFKELKTMIDQVWEKLEDIEAAVKNISKNPLESTETSIVTLENPLATIQDTLSDLREDVQRLGKK